MSFSVAFNHHEMLHSPSRSAQSSNFNKTKCSFSIILSVACSLHIHSQNYHKRFEFHKNHFFLLQPKFVENHFRLMNFLLCNCISTQFLFFIFHNPFARSKLPFIGWMTIRNCVCWKRLKEMNINFRWLFLWRFCGDALKDVVGSWVMSLHLQTCGETGAHGTVFPFSRSIKGQLVQINYHPRSSTPLSSPTPQLPQ